MLTEESQRDHPAVTTGVCQRLTVINETCCVTLYVSIAGYICGAVVMTKLWFYLAVKHSKSKGPNGYILL